MEVRFMKCLIITKKQLILCFSIILVLATLIGGSAGVFASGNKLLPIYCVETEKKQIAISFDAAWGNTKKVQNIS